MAGPGADGTRSIGAVAAELGVAPETLRSYGRRYGLVPSGRTAGGHRRYTADDLDRLRQMQQLITEGSTPSEAARAVTGPAPAGAGPGEPLRRSPGGRVLAVGGAGPQVRGLARAADRLDGPALVSGLLAALRSGGAVETWDSVIRPLMAAAGERWSRTGSGIEVEHLLSESVADALRRHRAAQAAPQGGTPVLLAAYPEDQHVLPLHAIAAGLAELRRPHLLLGPRTPGDALEAARRRTRARALFLWRQRGSGQHLMPHFAPTRPALRVVVGGPGWHGQPLPDGATIAGSLQEAVSVLSG